MKTTTVRLCAATAVAIALALGLAATAPAAPIASSGASTLPEFQGAPAAAMPISKPTKPEQNPFMASAPNSNIHNDSWMTDTYNRRGPLGNSLVSNSYAYQSSLCGSIAFDSKGRIVSVCPSIPFPPQARIIDPHTLAPISTLDLPTAPNPSGTKEFQNFAGGGYFFLDQDDNIWVATRTDHIYRISEGADGNTLTVDKDYDLTSVLDTSTERITSALPDYKGLIWFVSKTNGKVKVMRLDEEIENSFAVAADGVYIVSDKKMYRFKTTGKGKPRIIWSKGYPNSGIVKPSQVDAGSGTTPTIMEDGYSAITDNADPMHIVVYRNQRKLGKGEKRIVCKVPVFSKGTSATENALIGTKRSLIVENNYGYQDPFGPSAGALTEPGFARVDVKKNGKGCKKRWTNTEVRSPTVVPKLSTKTGLIYTYSRPQEALGDQGYFWTTIDFKTGKTRWMKYAGSGLTFNNNYAGLAIGPDGTAYLGTIGGIISLRDGG